MPCSSLVLQTVVRILDQLILLGRPNRLLLPIDLHLAHLPLACKGKASHAAGTTEEPMDPTLEACIVQQFFEWVFRGEQQEVFRFIDEADVEEVHLVAC